MTNREKYLDKLTNEKLALMIAIYADSCEDCPFNNFDECIKTTERCDETILKWLGEKS